MNEQVLRCKLPVTFSGLHDGAVNDIENIIFWNYLQVWLMFCTQKTKIEKVNAKKIEEFSFPCLPFFSLVIKLNKLTSTYIIKFTFVCF